MANGSATLRCKLKETAPNIYHMGWRRFMNELLLISPLVFLACITVQARTHVDAFRQPEYSPSMDKKIAAYIEPVRLFEEISAKGLSTPDPDRIRFVGKLWRKQTEMGVLRPLLPEAPGDTTREGVKGQIRSVAEELGAQLQRLARSGISASQFGQAADDALLSIEALQAVKYSDLYAAGVISIRQNSGLELLAQCLGHLSTEEKRSVADRIEKLNQSERPITDLVLAEQRTLSFDEQEANATYSVRRSCLELMLSLAAQLDRDRKAHSLGDLESEMKRLGHGDRIDQVLPALRFAWNARMNGNENWRAIETHLAMVP